MLKWFLSRLVRWAQKRCDHDPSHVSFDITESTVFATDTHVKLCHVCGAVAVCHGHMSTWRTVSTYP
jgi:hypothetical protein